VRHFHRVTIFVTTLSGKSPRSAHYARRGNLHSPPERSLHLNLISCQGDCLRQVPVFDVVLHEPYCHEVPQR
jgi:hypothetical protein